MMSVGQARQITQTSKNVEHSTILFLNLPPFFWIRPWLFPVLPSRLVTPPPMNAVNNVWRICCTLSAGRRRQYPKGAGSLDTLLPPGIVTLSRRQMPRMQDDMSPSKVFPRTINPFTREEFIPESPVSRAILPRCLIRQDAAVKISK